MEATVAAEMAEVTNWRREIADPFLMIDLQAALWTCEG
jgi:hypothetical protein